MDTTLTNTRAILVGMVSSGSMTEEAQISLDELERLLDTAGGQAVARAIQVKATPDPRTVIGKGKVAEILSLCRAQGITLAVFDFELTGAQIRNLEADMNGEVEVIDRSMLILDIFALHATSGEGKVQVELAQLRYTAPRLMGKGESLSRQGGGIGSRGPGESKLETDRRHLKERIHTLECELAVMEQNRKVMRQKRDRSGLPKVAIIGYTNAGKSTLLNALTDAGVLMEDKLFATLDPTTRRLDLPEGESVLLTDTVGFIRKLPHHLVEAFKSTLDEVRYADILWIVSDISDPELSSHLKVTEGIIEELGASDKPRLYIYNKCDVLGEAAYAVSQNRSVSISAKNGIGITELLSMLDRMLKEGKTEETLLIPYDKAGVISQIHEEYTVTAEEYGSDGVSVRAVLDERGRGLYRRYILDRNGRREDE